jgi:hypothetical protein
MGNPVKAFVYKACARAAQGYQQSYPQKTGMRFKALRYQALKPNFTSSLQEDAPTNALPWRT